MLNLLPQTEFGNTASVRSGQTDSPVWVVRMARENGSSNEPEPASDNEEVDWSQYVYEEQQKPAQVSLDVKDYVALFVASLETIFLPLVILGLMLLVIGLLVRI